MHRKVVSGLLASALLLGCAGIAVAAEEAKPLYVQTIAKYRAPALDDVGGREYKFLIDPAKMKGKPEDAFKDIWKKVNAAAEKNGFALTEKDKSPFKVELATKEYLDTAEQALFKAGYQIRVTNKYVDGKPDTSVAVNVKCVKEDARLAMAAPLAVKGGSKVKIEAEGNVGIGPGGQLREYIEKGLTFTVGVDELGKMNLADFGKFVPELLTLGLPADTAFVGKKAYYVPGQAGRGRPSGDGPVRRLDGGLRREGGRRPLPLRLLVRLRRPLLLRHRPGPRGGREVPAEGPPRRPRGDRDAREREVGRLEGPQDLEPAHRRRRRRLRTRSRPARRALRRRLPAGLRQALRGEQGREGPHQPVPAGRDEGLPGDPRREDGAVQLGHRPPGPRDDHPRGGPPARTDLREGLLPSRGPVAAQARDPRELRARLLPRAAVPAGSAARSSTTRSRRPTPSTTSRAGTASTTRTGRPSSSSTPRTSSARSSTRRAWPGVR